MKYRYFWDCKQRFSLSSLEMAKTILKGELNVLLQANLRIVTLASVLLESDLIKKTGPIPVPTPKTLVFNSDDDIFIYFSHL
jgi:hypothetical protein